MKKKLTFAANMLMLAIFFGGSIALGMAAADANITRCLVWAFVSLVDLIVMGFTGLSRKLSRMAPYFQFHSRRIDDEDRKDL